MAKINFTPNELKSEEWRDIEGYENFYQVSNLGRCRRLNAVKRKDIIITPCKGGWMGKYRQFSLSINGKNKQIYCHRAVLTAFIGKPPTKTHQANHINGNKLDNRLSNLEWVTPKENQNHRYEVLKQSQNGESNPSNKYTEKQIKQVLTLYKSGKYTQRKIATITGIDFRYVNCIVNRKVWAHLECD